MTKEQAYDQTIAPLMAQIIETAQKAGISMIAHFDISNKEDPGLKCTTIIPDGEGEFPPEVQKAARYLSPRPSSVFMMADASMLSQMG